MTKLRGSCHCENISLDIVLSQRPEAYNPRSCDCHFCVKHGASYLSDPSGNLCVRIKNQNQLKRYRQGSESADFLFCLNCGVLVGVVFEKYMALNSSIIDSEIRFGEKISVSPKKLNRDEKRKRWSEVWFSNVEFKIGESSDD